MKVLKTSAFCILLCICSLASSAQKELRFSDPDYNKPHLFSDLPKKMKLQVTNLESLMDLPVGTSVKTFLADNFNFHGTIVSKSDASDASVQSVVIRSTNRKGATLTFTKTIRADGAVKYLGRIISMKNGDAYDIVKEGDQYVLQKKDLYEMIND